MSDDSSYPISRWVASLELAVRAGDWQAAAEVADELLRLGVVVSIPRLGERLAVEAGSTCEGAADVR